MSSQKRTISDLEGQARELLRDRYSELQQTHDQGSTPHITNLCQSIRVLQKEGEMLADAQAALLRDFEAVHGRVDSEAHPWAKPFDPFMGGSITAEGLDIRYEPAEFARSPDSFGDAPMHASMSSTNAILPPAPPFSLPLPAIAEPEPAAVLPSSTLALGAASAPRSTRHGTSTTVPSQPPPPSPSPPRQPPKQRKRPARRQPPARRRRQLRSASLPPLQDRIPERVKINPRCAARKVQSQLKPSPSSADFNKLRSPFPCCATQGFKTGCTSSQENMHPLA